MANNTPPTILLIYTGGTIGMIEDPVTGALEPIDFDHLIENVPELQRLGFSISTLQYNPPIDSSAIEPSIWIKLAETIANNYDLFDGFVILHGTDTMSYTASALSFMLENLDKSVILTGSQLPIGTLRTDGKENLIAAIEIAAARVEGVSVVPEVCIFFDSHLMRGNRTSKMSSESFNAFRSRNYPTLARTGVHIRYDQSVIHRPDVTKPLKPHFVMDANIAILKLFPGITEYTVEAILTAPNLKGVVLETYGSGNAPNNEWFINCLKRANDRGIVIVNVTQCMAGSVQMSLYKTGNKLREAGVVCGYDSTTEAAVTKLMFLFGHKLTTQEVKRRLECSLIGEISLPSEKESRLAGRH